VLGVLCWLFRDDVALFGSAVGCNRVRDEDYCQRVAENALGIDDSIILDLDGLMEEQPGTTWPVELESTYRRLKQAKPERVVNAANLGDNAFQGADAKLQDVIRVLEDLRLEEWRLISAELGNQIVGWANTLLATMEQMAQLRASQPDHQAQHDSLVPQFEQYYRFFIDQVRPLCVTARVVEILRTRRDLLEGDLSQDRIDELRATFHKLEGDVEEFKTLSDLVTAQRQLVGKEGVSDLSTHFTKLAKDSQKDFKKWAKGLMLAVGVGGVTTIVFVYLTRPGDNAGNPEIISHTILDVLVVGLIIFLIRFVALQTRAHRQVEFVSRSKANALSTFNLIVAGQEDETVRAQIASALAQAVFKSDDGIFSDPSSDSITIIERVIGAASARASG
jgi:hypothetical protein